MMVDEYKAVSFLIHAWPYVAGGLTLLFSLAATGHAVLYKRDPRAAVAWVGLIWLAPVVGFVLYALFGINRLQRKASALRGRRRGSFVDEPTLVDSPLPEALRHLQPLHRLAGRITGRPSLPGNRVRILVNGDQAYPAMRQAIQSARVSVDLCTYIFDNDRAGRQLVEAVASAASRGVAVRVLIDDVGARHSWPTVVGALQRAGAKVARFLPTVVPWRTLFLNLRNHRKILVVDGAQGFTGGMNIREGHCLDLNPRHPALDLHFQVEGPVVSHLWEVFAEDWGFCTGEDRPSPPPPPAAGKVVARGIPDGPDEDFEQLRWILHGAIASARSSIRIVTPYFLPDQAMIMALNVAALEGRTVDILLPEKGNWRLVEWACRAQLWQLLRAGCRVWLTPPPFDHAKLMTVDGGWSLVGSTNWDPRSLRLNFEFNLECYDKTLTGSLDELIDARISRARQITLAEMDGRAVPVKLRDGLARLLTPYL